MNKPFRVVVIGGGVTGLAAAYRFQKLASKSSQSVDIQLLEASRRVGGVLQTLQRDGFLLEGGPDCFLSEKPHALQLCQELGSGDELIGTRPEYRRSFVVRDGQLDPVPEGFYLLGPSKLRPFLQSPLLSWKGKWRALMEPLVGSRRKDVNDESLASFVRRRFGREMLDPLAQPLVAGIYAADPETLSLRATFPQFLEMEKKYGSVLLGLKKRKIPQTSGARYSLFVTLRGGMQTLINELVKQLPKETISTALRAEKLCWNASPSPLPKGEGARRAGEAMGTWQLILSNGQTLTADCVLLALPAYASAKLLAPLSRPLADLLNSIPYEGSITVNWAFRVEDVKHAMNGVGFVVPHREKRSLLAATFVHRKFEGRVPEGRVLIRGFSGGALQRDIFGLGDAALEQQMRKDLQDLLGISSDPLFSVIQRWPGAMPQYTLGHQQRVLQIQEMMEGLKGLVLAGNWQNGVGIPDCIASGERAAMRLMQSVQNLSLR